MKKGLIFLVLQLSNVYNLFAQSGLPPVSGDDVNDADLPAASIDSYIALGVIVAVVLIIKKAGKDKKYKTNI